ncbi:hypothetical protein MYU51_012373 [Penicillium brevicompactum]|uniref:uncharacterized protein n=1 Tax=Penicillium brevicompactum TaxID=5074 RepID=UPI0025404FBB|nr:uncharacterized protein N7506_004329 [Penicillium brevicompactum]KAJ5336307.1 hypothetical protein N7506_004329 [Penicillium brevicompactum]
MGYVYDPSRPREDSKVMYHYILPDIPEKTIVGIYTVLPPNGATPSHTHKNAPITSYVISGAYRGGLNDGEPFTKVAKEGWLEDASVHVTRSENPSETEPAIFLSTVVIDTKLYEKEGDDCLYTIDPPYK